MSRVRRAEAWREWGGHTTRTSPGPPNASGRPVGRSGVGAIEQEGSMAPSHRYQLRGLTSQSSALTDHPWWPARSYVKPGAHSPAPTKATLPTPPGHPKGPASVNRSDRGNRTRRCLGKDRQGGRGVRRARSAQLADAGPGAACRRASSLSAGQLSEALSARKGHGGQSALHWRIARSRLENPLAHVAVAEISRMPARCGHVQGHALCGAANFVVGGRRERLQVVCGNGDDVARCRRCPCAVIVG